MSRELRAGLVPACRDRKLLGASLELWPWQERTLGAIERGQIVRVRLPRSALTVFGLPVNEEHVEETIRADVVLGEDGLARAVRFVK